MTTNDNDPRVSDAYREMASEQTAPELDRKVLAMAEDEVRGARGLPRTWFRPLAWAATIALSFALVLEITQVDDAATLRTDADLAEVLEEGPQPAGAAEKQKDEARSKPELNKRSSDAPAAAKATIAPAEPEAPARNMAVNPEARVEAAARDAAVSSPTPESAVATPEIEQDSPGLLREAEAQTRMRSEAGRVSLALVESKEQSDGCGETARASAEAWYECVNALRDAGRMEAAQQELEALLVDFPDFREPPGNQ